MRIAMVVPYDLAEEGGVKRHAMQLATSLRRLGDEVDVIGPLSERGLNGHASPHIHGFRGVVNIPANGSDNYLGIFACPWKVAKLFRERRYDVVHIHEPLQPSINYYALWSCGDAARIGTFHATSEQESAKLLRARKFWSAVAYPWYDRGIAVSPAAAEYASVTFKKPLAIIPNGIRTELYSPGAAPTAGPLKILFVGHWRDSRKGLPYLLEACGKLRAQGVDWTLDIVGDGGQTPRSELEGVTYHGPISSEQQLAQLYAACDVFAAPSMGGESFGIVLLEAMAAARGIVCSDIPGYRYAIGAGPECGAKLVPPGSVDGLVAAFAELAANPAERARMGAVNRERVRKFDWDRLVAGVREEYLAALSARGVSTAPHREAPAAAV
jgi:phosphatidylinositol alpha-mannosyltransferase